MWKFIVYIFCQKASTHLPRVWHVFSYQLLRPHLGAWGLEICQLVPLFALHHYPNLDDQHNHVHQAHLHQHCH